jgi:uncharacterized cupredoxin-like copper-binding protein
MCACGAIVLLALATSLPAQAKPPTERVQYVRVVATDYTFDAAATVPAGIVTFHLLNEGPDVHQLSVIELGIGHTLKDFFDGMRAKGQPPAWTVEVGMTPTIQPRNEAFLTVRLHPGRYILSCLIPAKDGRSHVEKGMSMLITVPPRVAARGGE